jgi:hypothetical protein
MPTNRSPSTTASRRTGAGHRLSGRLQRGVGRDRARAGAHDALDRPLARIDVPLGQAADHDVPLGDDAD